MAIRFFYQIVEQAIPGGNGGSSDCRRQVDFARASGSPAFGGGRAPPEISLKLKVAGFTSRAMYANILDKLALHTAAWNSPRSPKQRLPPGMHLVRDRRVTNHPPHLS